MTQSAQPRPANPRFDGDLRRALLDAAIQEVAVDDPANLSLRAVARTVGVSHAAPKNHFADKTALLTAIAVEGFDNLAGAMIEAAVEAGGGQAALVSAGRSYVRFAAEHPGHFRVMWRNEILDRDDEELTRAGEATFEGLQSLVADAQSDGWATGRPAEDLAVLAWSVVHGLAQLHLDGPLHDMLGDDLEGLAETTTALLRDAFNTGAP
jgi:AcrR family transcriptional regulator